MTELVQQDDPVADRPGVRGVQEREALDVAEAEGGHLEDDRRQTGPLDLRFGEGQPGSKVIFGIQADTDPSGDPPAASGGII